MSEGQTSERIVIIICKQVARNFLYTQDNKTSTQIQR